jgi:hypothetical protein
MQKEGEETDDVENQEVVTDNVTATAIIDELIRSGTTERTISFLEYDPY